jgi:hypothetical protein
MGCACRAHAAGEDAHEEEAHEEIDGRVSIEAGSIMAWARAAGVR